MFKIEKNVPLPEREWRASKYGFDKMEVGDSIFIPTEQVVPAIHSAPGYYAIRHPGTKFTTRRVEGGYRIWRIK